MVKINREKIKIKQPEIYCGYCAHYATGRYNKIIKVVKGKQIEIDELEIDEETEDIGEKTKKQFCAQNKQAEFNSVTCEIFHLHPFFYCKRHSQSLDISVCLSRQKKGREGCQRCPQGNMLVVYHLSKEVCEE
jgi:hypothetical protein